MESSMEFDAIIFIGPQGSGKGTQAKIFRRETRFFLFGHRGDAWEIATHDDVLAKQVKETIDHGKLLDDATIFEIVEKRINGHSKESGDRF